MDSLQFLNIMVLENKLSVWITAAGVALFIFFGLLLVKRLLVKRLSRLAQRTENNVDDLINSLIERTNTMFLLALGLYAGSLLFNFSVEVNDILRTAIVVISLVQAALWGLGVIDYLINRRITTDIDDEAANVTTLNALRLVAKIALWSIVTLLVLENITGIKVDSLIASLGIGGIAVALAVQGILGDLFSSLSIALDKPFLIGDFILVGDLMGTVENVGLKSTRVRSISGEQLIFSNTDLLNSRIRNFKRMDRRRVVQTLGVTYQTPTQKLKMIPNLIENIITTQDSVTFDRSHFKSYGDFALIFETVYFIETPDYYVYMDIQQQTNLAIFERFEAEGIEFAYPTHTVFVEKENASS